MRIEGGGSGNVNVLESDAGQYRGRDFVTANQNAYEMGSTQGAVAAEFPHIQLKNPVGSGRIVLVERIIIGGSNAGLAYLRRYDTDLATLLETWRCNDIGAADGVAEFRQESLAVPVGTFMSSMFSPADTPYKNDTEFPYLLREGIGLIVRLGTANTVLSVTFQGREV